MSKDTTPLLNSIPIRPLLLEAETIKAAWQAKTVYNAKMVALHGKVKAKAYTIKDTHWNLLVEFINLYFHHCMECNVYQKPLDTHFEISTALLAYRTTSVNSTISRKLERLIASRMIVYRVKGKVRYGTGSTGKTTATAFRKPHYILNPSFLKYVSFQMQLPADYLETYTVSTGYPLKFAFCNQVESKLNTSIINKEIGVDKSTNELKRPCLAASPTTTENDVAKRWKENEPMIEIIPQSEAKQGETTEKESAKVPRAGLKEIADKMNASKQLRILGAAARLWLFLLRTLYNNYKFNAMEVFQAKAYIEHYIQHEVDKDKYDPTPWIKKVERAENDFMGMVMMKQANRVKHNFQYSLPKPSTWLNPQWKYGIVSAWTPWLKCKSHWKDNKQKEVPLRWFIKGCYKFSKDPTLENYNKISNALGTCKDGKQYQQYFWQYTQDPDIYPEIMKQELAKINLEYRA